MTPTIVVALGSYLYFSTVGIGPTPGLVLAHAIHITPFVIITVMAGLRQVDPMLEVAATGMGAGRVTTMRRITLPLVLPSLAAGALFAFLISFDEVVIAYFVTGPATQTLAGQDVQQHPVGDFAGDRGNLDFAHPALAAGLRGRRLRTPSGAARTIIVVQDDGAEREVSWGRYLAQLPRHDDAAENHRVGPASRFAAEMAALRIDPGLLRDVAVAQQQLEIADRHLRVAWRRRRSASVRSACRSDPARPRKVSGTARPVCR